MAPTPQEFAPQEQVLPSDDGGVDSTSLNNQRVVISGMSGLYPSSHHIKELSDSLYNKVDLLAEPNPRWTYDNPEVPQHVGVVPELDKFDAQFFKVHYHLCCSMDTMGRKVLEQSYQAIYDAGVNPEQLSGKKIGVFIGSCLSETEKATFYVATSRNGFGIAGCNKSMFANRISYWLNAKGPSQAIDAACCSSTVALEQAYLAMSRGDCEAAIVGGANVCLHPQTSFHYGRTINLCKDGATRSYDQGANGCVRSEAINVLFLQKACDALRIYADVVHVKNSFVSLRKTDTGQKYGFGRDLDVMTSFLRSFYDEAKISPEEVEYVEGAGTADQESDKVELEAFDQVFCQNRTEPLKVGSVMSNIGYCEAATGITAVTKVLLGYHKGELAGNLHCDNPREDVEGLRDGRIEILSENKPIKRTYIGINGLSITGVNSHVLLDGHYKQKDITKYLCNLPRLVTLTGRQDTAVQNVINDLKSRPIDPEELALLQNIHTAKISGHLGRGYVILETDKEDKTVSLSEKADYFDGSDRPLWFVYSGMGSQWAGMGAQLMRIPIFSAAIERCHKVLEPKGIDIVHIITSSDKKIYDNILHSFVGIAAVQIGLTDILHALGLIPDKIIGHSVGELGCAYADGCLTAEEMILSAYSRGLVSIQTPFIRGSMAAVGIGFEEVSKMCPPEIEVACHNGPDSSTISGPAEIMTEFVAELTAKGIFAKEVPCSNIAYHSRYIAEAGPGLLHYLSDVIKTPKLRSEKWVSTSVPQDKWNEASAQYSSAEYHTNNLLSPVLFEETSRLVPATAVLVEVAPHGLLQAILKRSLPPSCAHVPLTRRAHPDNARFLLEAIGKIYMEGYYPDVRVLYPKVEFPVSTGTPHLSQLVEWAHNETWLLPLYAGAQRKMAATCTFVMSVHDSEYKYLQGNRINGSTLYPFAGALVLAWDTLAMTLGAARRQLSVQFRDVQLFAQPALHDSRQLRLAVTLQRGTGLFEVLDNGSRVATGYILAEKITPSEKKTSTDQVESNVTPLTTEDVYKIFSDRSYMYRDEFRSIKDANADFTAGHLLWNNNWVTFIDGILQFNTLGQLHDGISQPVYIRKLTINADDMAKIIETETELPKLLRIDVCPLQDYTKCEGILLESLRFQDIPNTDESELGLKVLKFIPRFSDRNDSNVNQILQVFAQIVDENVGKNFINIVEIFEDNGETSIFGDIKKYIDELFQIIGKYDKVHSGNMKIDSVKEADLVLISNLSTNDSMCQYLYKALKQNTFIITAEERNVNLGRVLPKALFNIVSAHNIESKRFELVQWRPNPTKGTSAFSVRTDLDLKLLNKARANLPPRHKMIIFASYSIVSEVKDLIKQWRKDSERNQVHLLTFKDQISENLTLDQLPDLDLAYNVVYLGELGGEYFVNLEQNVNPTKGVTLKSARVGDLDSLHWVETSCADAAVSGLHIKVHFAGLNAADAQRATGDMQYNACSGESSFGMDFSGTTKEGERVMGLVRGGALSDRVAAPELLWPVPEHWSLEDAATVPLPYAHAYYCLAIKTQLMPCMTILISGGAGATGQALIALALHIECRVFVVVSDILKKRFLLKIFPQLKAENVICSRDHTFADAVLSATQGRGCEVVICGKGESKNAYLSCCSPHGVTLDIDQVKRNDKFLFGMHHLTYERSYQRLDFSSIFTNDKTLKEVQWLVSEGIARGVVRPLSRVSYAPAEAPRAFRLLAASRHRGRVLLRLRPALPLPARPRIVCSADKCHFVLGDDEGFTLQVADRLVQRGARTLHLHSTASPARFSLALKSWQKLNVKVKISSQDLSDNTSVFNLLNESMTMGPIEGIFVLIGHSLTDQKRHVYQSLVANLDAASRKLCPSLRYFAVINSDTSVGEQICLTRSKDRLPAMLFSASTLKKVNITGQLSSAVNYRKLANAIEQGLRSSQPVIFAHTLMEKGTTTLLEQILKAAALNVSENDIAESATLQDLGMPTDSATDVTSLLRFKHNIAVDKEQVPFLTVQKIRDIEEMLKESDYSPKKGLGAIFSYVDPDELLATADMVSLLTQSSNSNQRDDEFDANQTFLCILPGLEGHHGRFRLMCERLKLSAIVLQPGLDNPNETVQEMTERFARIYMKKIGAKKFYLLGYEMGVQMALDMASIFEDNGMTGTVFCLGGGPGEHLAELERQLRAATASEAGGASSEEQALQHAVVRHMCALMGGGGSAQLEDALRAAPGWRETVEASVRALRGRVAHSAQYARALIEAAYARLAQARQHARAQAQLEPRALRSRVVLLRSPPPAQAPAPAAAAHPLQRYSQQPLVVHDLRAPLSRCADDLRVAAFVNQNLDQETLNEFQNKNLLDTYILNPLDFVDKDQVKT